VCEIKERVASKRFPGGGLIERGERELPRVLEDATEDAMWSDRRKLGLRPKFGKSFRFFCDVNGVQEVDQAAQRKEVHGHATVPGASQ
jgi:hypothetical protein